MEVQYSKYYAVLQVVNKECDKDMDYPSNGVSIFGCLRPVYADDEFYLRRLFHGEFDEDLYDLEWKGTMHFFLLQFAVCSCHEKITLLWLM